MHLFIRILNSFISVHLFLFVYSFARFSRQIGSRFNRTSASKLICCSLEIETNDIHQNVIYTILPQTQWQR